MTDLVALIVGISHYPELPESWHVQGDRTAHDAIEVTRALVARGADPKRFIEPRFLKELEDGGYIAELYKK